MTVSKMTKLYGSGSQRGGIPPWGGIWDFLGGIGYVVNFHFYSGYLHTFGKIDYCILFLISIKIRCGTRYQSWT